MRWSRSHYLGRRTGKIHIVNEDLSTVESKKALCKRDVMLCPQDYPAKKLQSVDPNDICGLCLKKAGLSISQAISSVDGELHTLVLTYDEILEFLIHFGPYKICADTAVISTDKNRRKEVTIRWVG